MATSSKAARVVTGAPVPSEPEPQASDVEKFVVAITLNEHAGRAQQNSVAANFTIEAPDAETAAQEGHRLAADFAKAVPFIPKEFRVNVTTFPGY